ncbi:MAG: SusC/RagA family TonB-linked outer membrane protein, partial [Mariniphaga sp.]|nr:SusC/RagA family TonB-linked outer membrane protein [Mariniphaga sp.]
MSRLFKKKEVPSGKSQLQMFLILSLTLVFLFPPKPGLANGRFGRNIGLAPDQSGVSVKDTIKPQSTDMGGEQQASRSISGTVKDAKGLAIPGATIVVKGTTTGVNTSNDGIFSLKLPTDSKIIVISFVGMKSQEIEVGTKTTFTIVLLDETFGLDEVVVIGYGSLQKKELTSSITSVSSKDFLEGSANNAMQVINGKVAGLSVSSSAPSDPNAGVSLQIRGASSIKAGTGPLVVIDGVPGGDLSTIVQQDIESISVLKDASSAAIYGTRGANGVIIVTTKKGTRNADKISVVYDSYVSTMSVARKPEILTADEFLEKKRDADLGARTDWYSELIRKTPIENNQFLSVSSGTQNTSYRASVNYRKADGIDIASGREEYGVRINFSQKALDGKFEFIGNVANRYTKEKYTDYGAFNQAMQLNPTMPVYDPIDPNKYFLPYGYDTYNPVAKLNLDQNGAERKFLNADLTFKFNILNNLNTQIMIAQQTTDKDDNIFSPSTSAESRDANRRGRAERRYEKWNDRTFEWTTNYSLDIDEHKFKLLAGYSYQDFTNSGLWAKNFDFPSDALTYNALGEGLYLKDGKADMNSWKGKNQLAAVFGRVNYSFNDLYLLSASLRYEGSSKFGTNNKFGLFPAVSAGWRISKMDFMKSATFVNDLKLRAGFGVAGREGFDRYTSPATYSGAGRYLAEGAWLKVFGPANNPNPDLKWEKAINYNVGLDFTLFNSRLS